ncbi:MAG: alpha-ketoglutarate-dependent dioxygenase AlkB, partial [Pseudomonadota bacterium]
MTFDLFDAIDNAEPAVERLADGAVVLRGFARPMQDALLGDVRDVIAAAPLRHLITPGGLRMSVAMTNCGALGWVSDRRGYRYDSSVHPVHHPTYGVPDFEPGISVVQSAAGDVVEFPVAT